MTKKVFLVFEADGTVIAVCDTKKSADTIKDMADNLLQDDGEKGIEGAYVVERLMNEVPDFLINRTYLITKIDGQFRSTLITYDEDYEVGIPHKSKSGICSCVVYADSIREAEEKASLLFISMDNTRK